MDKRVLIIDDDKWVVMSTQMVLEAEGYEVRTALNGPEGLEIAKSFRPAVVLLDILMPGIDGWETLERLRSAGYCDTSVIIFSARDNTHGDSEKCANLGPVTFFSKPFRPETLVQLVESRVEQVASQSS